MISKGTSSADVIRGINRMKAAGNPSKFVEQVVNVDDFWVILQSRLSNTRQPLNKKTVASVLDLPPNSTAVDDVFDELLLYERTDDLIADLNKTNRVIDDIVGGGGKTIRGNKETIMFGQVIRKSTIREEVTQDTTVVGILAWGVVMMIRLIVGTNLSVLIMKQ